VKDLKAYCRENRINLYGTRDADTGLLNPSTASYERHTLGFVLSGSDAFRAVEHIAEYMKFSFTYLFGEIYLWL
jgi:hypothetical protein